MHLNASTPLGFATQSLKPPPRWRWWCIANGQPCSRKVLAAREIPKNQYYHSRISALAILAWVYTQSKAFFDVGDWVRSRALVLVQ